MFNGSAMPCQVSYHLAGRFLCFIFALHMDYVLLWFTASSIGQLPAFHVPKLLFADPCYKIHLAGNAEPSPFLWEGVTTGHGASYQDEGTV